MDQKYVAGKIWNETKKTYQGVVGYEFLDTPGYFQFFEIGTSGHFRKRPIKEQGDCLSQVDREIYQQFTS